MKDWIPVKTEPMTKEEIKLYADDYDLNPGDPEAVTFRNPMPGDGEVIWITTEKGEVRKAECVSDRGLYWLNVYAGSYSAIGLSLQEDNWRNVLAWMPMETPKPYRAPDPRLIDAEALKEDLTELMAVNGELIDEWFAGCIIDTVNEQPIKAITEDADIRAKMAVWAHMLKVEGIGSKKLVTEQIEREIKRLDEK